MTQAEILIAAPVIAVVVAIGICATFFPLQLSKLGFLPIIVPTCDVTGGPDTVVVSRADDALVAHWPMRPALWVIPFRLRREGSSCRLWLFPATAVVLTPCAVLLSVLAVPDYGWLVAACLLLGAAMSLVLDTWMVRGLVGRPPS